MNVETVMRVTALSVSTEPGCRGVPSGHLWQPHSVPSPPMVTKRARLWLARGTVIGVAVVVTVLAASTWYYSVQVEREFLRWGPDSDIDRALFGPDPSAVGVDFREVLIGGPIGDHPAWMIGGIEDAPGVADTWVVLIHGIDADRREALRVLPAIVDSGHAALVVTYRNSGEGPYDGSGRHLLGRAEWPDIRSAVEFALAEGAEAVVLYGFGAGASVAASFLEQGRMEEEVAGMVFDAPLLDASSLVDRFGDRDKVPGFIVSWARAMVTFRIGFDWAQADHITSADLLSVPVLVFHGEDDDVYPVEASRRFAEASPDLVTLVTVPGAGHGESWNVDPSGYEQALTGFLAGLLEEE